ncbi:MAG: type I methionyl aminopeptidase [Planctomycetaceae bacterium]|nr:type I methionyl aminopeptidase [Planctomycetaceae bacterium]
MLSRRKPIPLYLEEEQREGLRAAGKFNAQLMDFLRPHVKVGVTTDELDRLANQYTLDHGHTPACLGYHGYPKTICTSVNEVVCHGIPNERPLRSGDIVNVDATTIVDGWYGDQSETFLIDTVSPATKRLVQTTFDSLFVGIRACTPGCSVLTIGKVIQAYAQKAGYSVVREYQGHGIGRDFHQEPGIPHFPSLTSGRDILHPGTCFTIEPMLNIGNWKTRLDKRDGWTVRTVDGSLSAQFEHTILMTEDGPEILTLTEHGPQEGHVF